MVIVKANAQFNLNDWSDKKVGLRQKKKRSLGGRGELPVWRNSESDGSCQKIKKNWNPVSKDLLMTCHKLVHASSATRAPGCLAPFPWSKIDKNIPLRPDVAGRGQEPVYEKIQREWRGWCKLFDCLRVFNEGPRKWDFWGRFQWNSGTSYIRFSMKLLGLATQK